MDAPSPSWACRRSGSGGRRSKVRREGAGNAGVTIRTEKGEKRMARMETGASAWQLVLAAIERPRVRWA